MEMSNLPVASVRSSALKTATCEDGEVAAAVPGKKLHSWIAVGFCVLCVLQATLNISLRLAFCEAAEELKRTNVDNLTEERDEWKRNLTLQLKLFNKERGELKEQLDLYASQQTSLFEERDELKKKLDDFIYYSQQQWVYLGGSFYYISSNKTTWQQSRDYCLQKSADLIIINTKEEQDFSNMFQKVMWIGLTDRQTEGVWKWVDGTVLTTSFWSSGEPNNYKGRNEDCGEIWYYNREQSWNDAECENENFWICEKKLAL
ncbi:CD209 antigen-like protein E [Anabas testudineus]|uniref:C-type lectin domain-containing protein n=1 Tax=Anabas testudineus TaxID=64144 RepID=A0A7N6ALS7_ANATE|nr:CD209 antigen-like protein E [Anabas testudineus]